MRRTSMLASLCTVALTATLAAAPSHATGRSSGHDPQVVAEGLAGPLTLAVSDRSNKVYVTQSFAGLLSKVGRKGTVTNLVADPDPTGEIVGVSLGRKGVYYIDTDYAAGDSHVMRVDSKGRVKQVSKDLFDYEEAKNPDRRKTYGFTNLGRSCAAEVAAFEAANPDVPMLSKYKGIIESHGYQTSVDRGNVYVADAAANAILKVDERSGKIRTVAVIPATPVKFSSNVVSMIEDATGMDVPDCVTGKKYLPEPVPTDVEIGRDGKLYVSTLEGWLGEMMPLSSVYRVDARSGKVKKVASRGMHGVTGLDLLGKDIVVAEMFGGEVSVVKSGRGKAKTLFTADSPADVEVRGKTVYATTGTFGPNGMVVRYRTR